MSMDVRQLAVSRWAWRLCACLLGIVGLLQPVRADEDELGIVPIQFAELMEPEDALRILTLPAAGATGPALAGEGLRVEELSGAVEEIAGPSVVSVSSRAADGLRIEEFELDEMPYEASSGEWFSSGRWYGSADSLWFSRSRNYRRTLGRDVTYVPPLGRNKTVGTFTTTALPFDLVPGGRFTLGKSIGRDYLDRDQFLEVTYYGGFSFFQKDYWNALPGSFLVTPLDPIAPGFFGAQTYGTTINSIYNSMEWNYKLKRRLGRDQLVMSPNGNWSRHAERGWLASLSVGSRLANVNEEFTFFSRRTNVALNQFSGDYAIQTQNWLWGLNLGSELLSQNEFYYWGIRGGVTPAMSFAANQQTVVATNQLAGFPPETRGSLDRRDSAQQVGPGFIGDLTIFAGWQVTPNFSVRAGYDFLWVAGIATATRQFNLDNIRPNSIDGGGQILFNGLSLGCEGSW